MVLFSQYLGVIRWFIPISPKVLSIRPKVNVMAQLEFELAYNDAAVQHDFLSLSPSLSLSLFMAQSVGAVEYTDCIFAER